jgi:hypothetical protein
MDAGYSGVCAVQPAFYGKFGYIKVDEWTADDGLLLYAYEMRPG